MLGSTKKVTGEPPKRKGAELMNQMGLGIPGQINQIENMCGDLEGDEDLEAELAALTGEEKSPQKNLAPKKPAAPKRKGPAEVDLAKMVAESLRDYASDEELSDTEDPDLLAELNELTTEEEDVSKLSPSSADNTLQKSTSENCLSVIEERMSLYSQAFANAKAAGDSSKQRRLDRGLKTLNDLLRRAKSGKAVDESEIPPTVAVGSSTPSPSLSPAHKQVEQQPETQASPAKKPAPVPPPSAKLPSPVTQPAVNHTAVKLSAPKNLATSGSHPAATTTPTTTSVPVSPPAPTPAKGHLQTDSTSTATSNYEVHKMLSSRRDQYKHAALEAKKNNDMKTASKYVKILKQFDSVILAAEEGKPIDLSQMPPPPPELDSSAPQRNQAKEIASPSQTRFEMSSQQGSPLTEPEADDMPPALSAEEEKKMFNAPDAPKSVEEALQQRLEKYKSAETDAKNAGESGKARRMGRIVKQYQDAMKAYKAGKHVDFDELPTPPGYAPIPFSTSARPQVSASVPESQKSHPAPTGAPSPRQQAPQPPQQTTASPRSAASVPAPAPRQAARPKEYSEQQINRLASQRKNYSTRSQQQETFLKERYAEFKEAALTAKKNADIELAKKYLRFMKGLEPMIQACESGFPIDLSQVPPSPNVPGEADKFVIVSPEDCTPTGDRTEVFTKLETDLKNQIRICATNSQHFRKLGDVASAERFQKLEDSCRKDLDALKNASLHGDPVPKFHYETKCFSVVRTNTDLGDGEMELNVIRGIQYHLPNGFSEKDLDTYVKCELPYPNEDPQEKKFDTVKGSINPEYDEKVVLQINRKARAFARVVDRKGIKLDIFYKRGFLKGDKLLGTVNVKLMPLDNQCTLHDSYDLMDGRKSVGGKLEIKVRVRDPFKNKQVDEVKEKWLVIDQFLRTQASLNQSENAKKNIQRQKSEGAMSMEVLRYEKQQLDKQIAALKDSLSLTQLQTLKHKSSLLQEKIELQQKKLREGGKETWKAYIAVVKNEIPSYEAEAKQYAKLGDIQKAQLYLNKKKMVQKELVAIKQKFPDLL